MNFQLASRFSRRNVVAARSDTPMTDDQIRKVAPSIFAESAHASRSDRYTYLPTIDVINGLRREGFQPFAVAQTRVRDADKAEHTKHLIRLRHASNINDSEAKEVVLLNSHDGSSCYQMLAGMFRFVCANGMVCGETHSDVRVRHSGNVIDNVIEGATRVLENFEEVTEQRDGMRALTLNEGEQQAFGRAALLLKYDEQDGPAPITERQVLGARRRADDAPDLWTTFNRVQENLVRGGLTARNKAGRRTTTRGVNGIDQSVKLNRALWQLAEEMRRLKGTH